MMFVAVYFFCLLLHENHNNFLADMKKFIFTVLVLFLPFGAAIAQKGLVSARKLYTRQVDFACYERAGAVPVVDGRVVFAASIEAAGRSKEELYRVLASWTAFRFAAGTKNGNWREPDFFCNLDWAQVKEADREAHTIKAQGAEEMVFSNKALAKDYSHVFYLLDTEAKDGRIDIRMHNIIFSYVGSQNAERIPAEEMITDKWGLNRKGHLARINGKFRLKTIDLFNEFVDELTAAARQ